MFDISFTELMVIGMIALVVIGPERLPKVARTIGHLLGRAQRYVNDVKTDIKREMDAGDLNNIKNQFEEAASTMKASLDDASKTIGNPLLEAQKAVENAGKSLQSSMVDFEGYEPPEAAAQTADKAPAGVETAAKPAGPTPASADVTDQVTSPEAIPSPAPATSPVTPEHRRDP